MATFLNDDVECVDPLSLRDDLAKQRAPIDRWWMKANAFTTGPGCQPGRGWVLLRKAQLDSLTLTGDLSLTFSGEDTDHVLTLSPITLLNRECISPGSPTDPYSVYLCEVVDRRYLLGRIPLDAAYNVTKADGSGNFAQTLNTGVAWTWQEIVTDIATVLSLGTLDLPFTPDATPNNFVFWGHPSDSLEALCNVLDRIACDLAYDPVADEFTIVRLGSAADSALTALTGLKGKVWDGYSTEEVRGYYPQYVRVRFMRRPVDSASGFSPYWFEDISLTAATGVEDGTFVQIDDDLPALGASGTPSNSAATATRAAERAADWLRKRQKYDRPLLTAWRDFIPDASGLGAYAVHKVVFDDRGDVMKTWGMATPDMAMEKWRPQNDWPVWWPIAASSGKGYLRARAATTTTLPANTYSNGTSGVGATLTGNSNGALSAQDGVTLVANDVLLVKDESTGANKGVYALTQVGDGSHPYILTRTADADSADELLALLVAVEEGTTNADTLWLCTADATITVGTTALPWVKIGPLLFSSSSAWKSPAVCAATTTTLPANTYANGTSGVGATLTGNSNAALSAQDGVTLTVNQDLLVKTESTASHNGIYTLTQVGDGSHPYILTRRTDADEPAELLGAVIVVEEGTINADTVWLSTANATITVGTTSLPWIPITPLSIKATSSALYDLATPSGTWQDTSGTLPTLLLPTSGTYLVTLKINSILACATVPLEPGSDYRIAAALYDSTAGAYVPNSIVRGQTADRTVATGAQYEDALCVTVLYTVSTASTLRVQAWGPSASDDVNITYSKVGGDGGFTGPVGALGGSDQVVGDMLLYAERIR